MKMMTGSTPKQMALIVLTGYMVIGFILMNLYPHQMTTDSLSYISIAQKYARGHFHDAVNWVWSPLISWLLAPFVLIGIHPSRCDKNNRTDDGHGGIPCLQADISGIRHSGSGSKPYYSLR